MPSTTSRPASCSTSRPTDREAFMRAIALDNRAPDNRAQARSADGDRRASGDPRPLVVIDPGHGGIDNGTRAASGETGEDHRPRILAAAARQDREDRQIPRGHDPHRRHLRGARRPRGACAFAPGLAVHLDPCRRAGAREGDAQGATVYTLSERASDAARRAACRGREPGRRHRRARPLRRAEATSPAS